MTFYLTKKVTMYLPNFNVDSTTIVFVRIYKLDFFD